MELYELNGKTYRYDRRTATVEQLTKATEQELEDNKEWQAKYGKDLWEIDADGYTLVDSIGLSPENWEDKEARDEYLEGWQAEQMEEATAWLS